ncbi:unnamed protein product [Chrysoparadoxa australica]
MRAERKKAREELHARKAPRKRLRGSKEGPVDTLSLDIQHDRPLHSKLKKCSRHEEDGESACFAETEAVCSWCTSTSLKDTCMLTVLSRSAAAQMVYKCHAADGLAVAHKEEDDVDPAVDE